MQLTLKYIKYIKYIKYRKQNLKMYKAKTDRNK